MLPVKRIRKNCNQHKEVAVKVQKQKFSKVIRGLMQLLQTKYLHVFILLLV